MSSSCKCLFCVSKHDSDSTAEGRLAAGALCQRGEERRGETATQESSETSQLPRYSEPSRARGQQHFGLRPHALGKAAQLDGILLADLSTPACGSAANQAFLVEGQTRRLLPTFVQQENQIEGVQFTVRTVPQPGLSQLCGLIRPKEQQQQQQWASFKELIGKSLPG